MTPEGRRIVRAAFLAFVIAAVALAARASVSDPAEQQGESTWTTVYQPPHTRAEAMLNQHDGQGFAALAMDPTLSRPDVFASPAEMAYRAARPLLGWLAWAGSLGQHGAVAWVLLVLTAASAAALVVSAGALAVRMGRDIKYLLAVLLLPGCVVQLARAGLSDSLAAALAVGGVALWLGDRRRAAVVLLTLAVLGRETSAVVVVGIAAWELWSRRSRLRDIAPLAVPLAAYGAWVLLVRERVGAWPTDARRSRLAPPLVGFLGSLDRWNLVEVAALLVGVGVVVAAARRGDAGVVLWIAAAYGVFGLVLGEDVWASWEDFSRVLLPAYAMCLVAAFPLAPSSPEGATEEAVIDLVDVDRHAAAGEPVTDVRDVTVQERKPMR